MHDSRDQQQYAYISCPRIQLNVIVGSSESSAAAVTLLAKRNCPEGKLWLLVEQEASPRLFELEATLTNLAELEPLPEVTVSKFVPERLFQALRLIKAGREPVEDLNDVSVYLWKPEPEDVKE